MLQNLKNKVSAHVFNIMIFKTLICLNSLKRVPIYVDVRFFFPGKEMPTTGSVAIAVLSTLLVIAILIIIFMGRKLISNQTSKRHTDVQGSQKQDTSQTYTDLTVRDETHAYSTLGPDVHDVPYQVISDASNKMK